MILMMILYYDDIIVYDTYDSYTVNNLMILMDGERKTKKQNWGAPPFFASRKNFDKVAVLWPVSVSQISSLTLDTEPDTPQISPFGGDS